MYSTLWALSKRDFPENTLHNSVQDHKNLFLLSFYYFFSLFSVLQPETGDDCRRKTTIKWKTTDPDFNEQVICNDNQMENEEPRLGWAGTL